MKKLKKIVLATLVISSICSTTIFASELIQDTDKNQNSNILYSTSSGGSGDPGDPGGW